MLTDAACDSKHYRNGNQQRTLRPPYEVTSRRIMSNAIELKMPLVAPVSEKKKTALRSRGGCAIGSLKNSVIRSRQ